MGALSAFSRSPSQLPARVRKVPEPRTGLLSRHPSLLYTDPTVSALSATLRGASPRIQKPRTKLDSRFPPFSARLGKLRETRFRGFSRLRSLHSRHRSLQSRLSAGDSRFRSLPGCRGTGNSRFQKVHSRFRKLHSRLRTAPKPRNEVQEPGNKLQTRLRILHSRFGGGDSRQKDGRERPGGGDLRLTFPLSPSRIFASARLIAPSRKAVRSEREGVIRPEGTVVLAGRSVRLRTKTARG